MPKLLALLISLAIFLIPSSAYAQTSAASLKLSPATSSKTVGQSFTVGIRLTSTQAVGSVPVYITFPVETLEVTSISKTGSVASIFVEEPKFDNIAGSINMTADIASPGYTGTDGLIATITFKAKANGIANVSFNTQTAVYPTSGNTNILGASETATYTIGGGATGSTASGSATASPEPTGGVGGTDVALPETASSAETVIGILAGVVMILSAVYLKMNRKSA